MKKEAEDKYYKIGKISKICNIPVRTLHHYDNIDLLKPAKVDSINNYRYYSHDQLLEINTIKYFKEAGFSLNQIKKLLERNDLEYSRQMIKCKSEEIETNILKLTSLKNKLNVYLEKMISNGQNFTNSIDICVKDIPISYVAYSRYIGPCRQDEFYLRFTKLTNVVEKNNLRMIGTMMAIYYDDYRNFDYLQSDIEVCVKVDENREYDNTVRKFGGFLGVVAYHYGSYSTMNQTYRKMLDWLDKNELAFLGGAVENYIIDAITTSCEDDYITEIILPVKNIN
ncbi:MerR family transcriptional regulator [Maledivibacter halophilus]|uniref:DNA-binding transcriptional regulator, MerR family n=1 Tax=Maledivibacter halophilus TaxID=36842 RepID=A0A1T5KHI3_9FIRM|nr:MerR family transcriptional regulator [Maledivibacter halophilus]SKC62919.1 DNA-binding transcriptional regulator, MerR family [Maledivibacter halophilus]